MMNITFENIITTTISLSVVVLFISIIFDFTLYNDKNLTKKTRKSIVATGTMIGFYIIYYMVIRFKIGIFYFNSNLFTIFGTLLIVFGSVINILGRFDLGSNWANHIKIYETHKLITTGMYRFVRHPLYASIMLMLFGGSIVYRNLFSGLLNSFVFIPFMYYRARQEERLLMKEFKIYIKYKRNTGMFFPKFWRRKNV